jgi:RNA polymerase sigma-70 factor (TIGR02960 family)
MNCARARRYNSMTAVIDTDFATLTQRHRRELHVHCYRMLGNYQDAEEHVQETFLRAWRSRETFSGAQLRAWLYRIATNACLDTIKSRRRRPGECEIPWLTPFPDRVLDDVAPAELEPEAVVVARETIELTFIALIQLLPARQRAVLILRDVLDWSAAETAAMLELSVPAANSALQRARAAIGNDLPEPRPDELSEAERALLQGFIDTHERNDMAGAAALMREDIHVSMPPFPSVYDGREAMLPLLDVAFGPDGMGEWKLVPIRANRMPAAASYLRAPGETGFRAFKIDVLREAGGLAAEITTFGSDLFGAFGLPDVVR